MKAKFLVCLLIFLVTKHVVAKSNELIFESAKKVSPILIFVHGGAWVSGSPEDYRPLAENLSKRGVCVVLAKYRLAPAFKHPSQIEELNEQVEATSKIKLKNCDRKNIFLMGHSAGAHMIAYWASQFNSPSIQGFIGLEGIYDLVKLAKTWPTYVDWFIKPEFKDEKLWLLASPSHLTLKNKKPWLIIHSLKDELVDINQSKDFKKHLEIIGIPNEFLELKLETHFEVVQQLFSNQKSSKVEKTLLQFMKENLQPR
jgi:kynurenine formamidase